eukprot:535197_1
MCVKKANLYINTTKAKKISSRGPFKLYYDIENGTPLTISNILSLVMYTDWSDLCKAFSATFRKEKSYESINSVKQRNREYANWSKLLRETVEYYGQMGWCGSPDDIAWNKKHNRVKGPFFSGMSFLMVFPEYSIRLCGPTSTSKQVEVAARFASDDGILIQLNNYGYFASDELCTFCCSWLSNYDSEDEYLFCGGYLVVKIESITIIDSQKNYAEYCHALFYFDSMLKGIQFTHQTVTVSDTDYLILNNLIQYEQGKTSIAFKKSCPQYIKETFKCFIHHKKQISINLETVNKELKKLKSLIVEEQKNQDNILKVVLFKLFDNCRTIVIHTTDMWGAKEYKFDLISFLSFISINSSSIYESTKITIIGKWEYFKQNKCSWIGKTFTSEIKSRFFEKGYVTELLVKEDSGMAADDRRKEDHLTIKKLTA